jgi:gamma-D-glutamyl-L-lysine dipeptidyl-peptidase
MIGDFALCHLPCLPLRKEANHRSESISSILFGETFKILDHQDDWFEIELDYDKYRGFVSMNNIKILSEKQFHEIESHGRAYSMDLFQQIESENRLFYIGIGSHLPLFNKGTFKMAGEEYKIRADVVKESDNHSKDFIFVQAVKMLGIPYLWGGKSSFGTDCSGLVQSLFKFAGIRLPRDAWQQEELGEEITLDQAVIGDLAFFSNAEGHTDHVGIVSGHNSIIHASMHVRIDKLDHTGIYNRELESYTHKLKVLRRIAP